ncbi:MAG: dihydrolipoyl dehydrogenase [Spirochaetales bacterium]|nr:dihydrolipoyl dehydrogenase [Spirochaetales bacterium]
MAEQYDAVIIGAGPGGYVAAIRGAQLGLKVALVEKGKTLGGTCLNIGCIPSKALLDASEQYWKCMNTLEPLGILVGPVELDLGTMMKRKEAVVKQLTDGVKGLMKKNSVAVIHGNGSVRGPGTVQVTIDAGEIIDLNGKSVVIATGSVPAELSAVPFDGDRIVSSTDALSFGSLPGSLAVIGAGAIGLELGSVWSRLGSDVTIIELMDTILPGWDLQTARTLKRSLTTQGINFALSTTISNLKKEESGVRLHGRDKKGDPFELFAQRVLVAVGRVPALINNLENIGVVVDGGRIAVDESFQTSLKGVYAIGDCIAGPMLAHKAGDDAIACMEILAGGHGHVDYGVVPSVVYTQPEAAMVGKTEEQLKGAGAAYENGSFPFRANGRALASGETEGFVKLLTDADSDRILGAHILGQHAASLIAEVVSVMAIDGSAEDLARTSHAHPTLPEAIREAALAVGTGSIHSA